MNGSQDCPPLEVRNHLLKEVGGDQFHFSVEPAGADGMAHRETIGGTNIKARQRLVPAQERINFLKCFILVVVTLNDFEQPPAVTELSKLLRKTLHLLPMVLRLKHSRDNRYLGLGRQGGRSERG